jgi:hypothetical protein
VRTKNKKKKERGRDLGFVGRESSGSEFWSEGLVESSPSPTGLLRWPSWRTLFESQEANATPRSSATVPVNACGSMRRESQEDAEDDAAFGSARDLDRREHVHDRGDWAIAAASEASLREAAVTATERPRKLTLTKKTMVAAAAAAAVAARVNAGVGVAQATVIGTATTMTMTTAAAAATTATERVAAAATGRTDEWAAVARGVVIRGMLVGESALQVTGAARF